VEVPAAPMSHSLRLRDGEREIEVSGSAAFVRQVLDDLPAMWTRLHGEGSTRPARIDLPAHAEAPAPALPEHVNRVPESAPEPARTVAAAPASSNGKHTTTRSTPDDKVLAVLKDSTRPLAVAAIRKRLGGSFTPQQVRRILERNAPKVSVTDERPATYRLR
jgi:transglutaminase-like putative cysteine protease